MLKLVIAILMAASLTACSTLKKVNCKSQRLVPVVFITETGSNYIVMVPFCDTVLLGKEPIPDTVAVIMKAKRMRN